MINVLTINTSINDQQSNSNKLVSEFITRLSKSEQTAVTERNLSKDNLPHLNSEEMQAWMIDAEQRTAEQEELAALSDSLITELESSDVIVIGMPMYNFGIPSVFKTWIDRVARAGKTFRYTENGPVGLLENKKVFILAARGGMYAGTPKDTQSLYLRDVFSFIGINDIEFVYAEGLAMGDESAKNAFQNAEQKIVELIDNLAA